MSRRTQQRNIGGGPFFCHIWTLIGQLNDRFTGRSKDAMQAIYLLPGHHGQLRQYEGTIKACCGDDLPSPSSFHQELWERHWSTETDQPKTISDTLKRISKDGVDGLFPNISVVLRIFLSLPATSASVERANSALRYVKNAFWSVMSEDRFNALILMYVHRDIKLDYDCVIDMYARRFPRRILFNNPLSDK